MPILDTYPLFTVEKPHESAAFFRRCFGLRTLFEASWVVVLSRDGSDSIALGLMASDHPSQPPGPELFRGTRMIYPVGAYQHADVARALLSPLPKILRNPAPPNGRWRSSDVEPQCRRKKGESCPKRCESTLTLWAKAGLNAWGWAAFDASERRDVVSEPGLDQSGASRNETESPPQRQVQLRSQR